VPRRGVGVPLSSPLRRSDPLHGKHGPRGAQVDAAHGRGPREAGDDGLAAGGVRLRGTDAARGVTPRGNVEANDDTTGACAQPVHIQILVGQLFDNGSDT